jgi:hypothetical protein
MKFCTLLVVFSLANANAQTTTSAEYFSREVAVSDSLIRAIEALDTEATRKIRAKKKYVSGVANDMLTVEEQKNELDEHKDVRLLRAATLDNATASKSIGKLLIKKRWKRDRMFGALLLQRAAALGEIESASNILIYARKFNDEDLYRLAWSNASLELKLFPHRDKSLRLKEEAAKREALAKIPELSDPQAKAFVDVIHRQVCAADYFKSSYDNFDCR